MDGSNIRGGGIPAPGAGLDPAEYRSSLPLLAGVTILVGIGAGVGGMSLALILHLIQHLAFGYSPGVLIGSESFLQGVIAASPVRKVMVLGLCGLIAGGGWWIVYRYGRPLVSISKAVRAEDPRMPVASTTLHALLQIITVALGSPLGREVAPREIAAVFAGWLAHRCGLTASESRLMVACGAGAGLAAVYNVPLAGTLFILEVLLGTFRPAAVVPALASCAIAALVAWIGLGDESQYTLHVPFAISPALVILSALAGPIFGAAAFLFVQATMAARKNAPKDARLLVWCVPVFLAIGLLSIRFPGLLGNGKGPIQSGLDDDLGMSLAAMLLLLKLLATTGSLRAGAEGGLLTPGMTIGALIAILLVGSWNSVLPAFGILPGAFAIVGAAAFLAASMKMPITAIVLALEFTRVDHDFLFPILLSVAGSISCFHLCAKARSQRLATSPTVAPPLDQGEGGHGLVGSGEA